MDEANTLRFLYISFSRDGTVGVNLKIDKYSKAHRLQADVVKWLAPYGGGVSIAYIAKVGAAPGLVSVVDVCQRAQLAIAKHDGKESLCSFFGDAFVERDDPSRAEIRLTYELDAQAASAAAAARAAESDYTSTSGSESEVSSLCAGGKQTHGPQPSVTA